MGNVLGLIGFILYIALIISAAAGLTWVVVRLTPAKKPKTDSPAADA
jgi:hypothetical protein